MRNHQMKVGVWFYGLGTALTGILDIAWGAFDASHQPIRYLGKNLPGQPILAYVAGVWLVAAGLAILWRRSARIGAMASALAYLMFAALWLLGYFAAVHALGWRIDVLAGITFGLVQQLMLVAPAAIVYASTAPPDSLLQKRAAIAARWMLGLPPILFGLSHFAGIRVFASIVPQWIGFGYFWAGLTGITFFLAGSAICSGIMDALAARLLALMLLLFEGFVEIPPIFIRLHNQATWGAAVYNLFAIGACWIFAEFLASRADRGQIGPAENVTMSRPDPVVRDSVTRGRRWVLGSLRSNIRMLLALGVLSVGIVWAVDSGQYPDNFRRWVHVGTGVILPGGVFPENEQGMHHIFANQKAVDGYTSGDFPDGSVIVYELREAQQKNGIIFEGERRRVDVMIKASSLYNKTGGWKFERFLGNQEAQDAVHDSGASCFQCHANANAHGFVFSQLR